MNPITSLSAGKPSKIEKSRMWYAIEISSLRSDDVGVSGLEGVPKEDSSHADFAHATLC